MAITYDNGSSGWLLSTSLTYSHTVAGTDKLLIVWVATNTADVITGVTYNGVAMTLAKKQQSSTTRFGYMFYLVAPSAGANNVVVSASSSVYIDSVSASYNGVDQTTPINTTQGLAPLGVVTTLDYSLTITVDNCWIVCNGGIDRATTAGTNLTGRTISPLWSSQLCDSNSPLTPSGVKTASQNLSGSITGAIMGVALAIAPSVGAVPPSYSTSNSSVTVII